MERERFGDYELLRQISKGPLGTVYHAEHRFLKKHYALKILPDNFDKEFAERLKKEASSLFRLDHPHLVKIHNISEYNGQFFLVCDLTLDPFGEYAPLLHFLNVYPHPIDEQKIFSILYQLALALDYLHEESITHRFFNPYTILVGKEEDGLLSIFLDDAGIASIIGEGTLLSSQYHAMAEALAVSFSSEMTVEPRKLEQLQTLFQELYPYLAPEQRVLKGSKPITAKADAFAFGTLAYYLLFREIPLGFFSLPSTKLPLQYDWDALICQCLNQDPSKRPSSLTVLMQQMKKGRVEQQQEEKGTLESWEASKNYHSVPLDQQIFEMREKAPAPKTVDPIKEIARAIEEGQNLPARSEGPISQESLMESRLTPTAHSGARFVGSNSKMSPQNMQTALLEEQPGETQRFTPHIKAGEIHRPEFDLDPSAMFHTESVTVPYKPKEKEVTNFQPLQTKMVVIPEGEYYRGSTEGARDEKPFHKIKLSSFAIDIHAVTNEQYVRFLEVMGGEKDYNNNDLIRLRESRIKRSAGRLIIESGYAKHPIVGVTWYGAVAYARWVGKRLPTEAEWEVAARSLRSDMTYPTGATIERYQANFFSSDTSAVMSFPPNQIGLFDMAGNVYEWCEDWYDYSYYDTSQIEPENPKGPQQGVYRVLRGGCWKSLRDDMRCSHRHRNNPGSINTTYGFRCACDAVENE